MDPAVNKHKQWSSLQREVEIGCGYWYLDLCLVAYSVILESNCYLCERGVPFLLVLRFVLLPVRVVMPSTYSRLDLTTVSPASC